MRSGMRPLCRGNEVLVEGQLKHLRLQWIGHVMRTNRNRVQRQLHCSRLKGKVRPRGRTPLQWIDLVSRDLVSIESWMQVAHDKPQWCEAIRPYPTYILMRTRRMKLGCVCVSTLVYAHVSLHIIGHMHTNVLSY